MPTIDIDLFDDEPKVGDKVRVKGKVESIDEDTGKVEISYDDVDIVGKEKKRKKRRSRDNDNDFDDDVDIIYTQDQMNPNTQTLDQALGQAFPNTQ